MKWNAATSIRRKTPRLSAWFMWERSISFIKIPVTLTQADVLFLLSRVLSDISALNICVFVVTLLNVLYSFRFWFWFSFNRGGGGIFFVTPLNHHFLFNNIKKMWYRGSFIKLNIVFILLNFHFCCTLYLSGYFLNIMWNHFNSRRLILWGYVLEFTSSRNYVTQN